jgi:hypothetical protein
VIKLAKDVPATVTAAPVPLSGINGAGSKLSLEVIAIRENGITAPPLLNGVFTVARKLTCPALLRTSTGNTALVAVKVGALPFQFAATLLPLLGAPAAPGICKAVLIATASTVLLAVGYVPVPTRKNRNLPIARLKSKRALAETAWVGLLTGACMVCVSAQTAVVQHAHTTPSAIPRFI